MKDTLNLSIEGMHCDGCVRRVSTAIGALRGVQVEAVAVGSATVAYEPAQISPEEIRAAVNRIGFTVLPGAPHSKSGA